MKRVLAAGAAFIALALGGHASAATFVFNGSGGALPDLVDFHSTISVGETFNVQDVDLTLNDLNHTFFSDIAIYLSHNGVSVLVHDTAGGSGDPHGTYTFDDEAALSADAINYVGGTFRPANPLSAFDGLTAGGDWTLRILDRAGADAGSLGSWSLTLSDGVAATGAPEPAGWALMIGGFFGAGALIRRRRIAAA